MKLSSRPSPPRLSSGNARPWVWCLALAWATTLLGACGDGQQASENYRVESRFIADSATEKFERSRVLGHEQVAVWRFDSPQDRLLWKLTDLSRPKKRGRSLAVRVTGPRPQLVRETELDARSADVFEFSVSGLRKGVIKLYWAGAGENFSSKRSLTHHLEQSTGNQVATYRLDLLSHPGWSGSITRVGLVLPATQGTTLKFERIRWLRSTVDDAQLSAALEKNWKVELDSDSRPALLCPPGIRITRNLHVSTDSMLSFSYGLEPAVNRPVTFIASMAVADGNFKPVFSGTLDPRSGQSNRWFTTTVPLQTQSEGRVRFRLETSSEPDLDSRRAFPVWSNIEVLTPQGSEVPPNIVVVLIDTLRADRLSSYGHDRQTSPNIDRWAKRSAVLFENVVAPAPWTLPSHVSLFSGLDAVRHGVNHNLAAPRDLTMLAEILRSRGYTTAAITGGAFLRPTFGLDQGFDSFRYWPQVNRTDELADGTERTLAWLRENHNRRFFLFFHTYEVHGPHRRRSPYFRRIMGREADRVPLVDIQSRAHDWEGLQSRGDYFVAIQPGTRKESINLSDDEKRLVRGMYDSAIAYTDDQVQRILDQLDTLGLTGKTIVVLTSDHGEALGEDDRAGHHYLNEYNIMVPLIIGFPDGLGSGRRIVDQVRLTDVLPTVLEVIGEDLQDPLDGSSLMPLIRGDTEANPREAWTYGSSTNFGIGLRFENRLKYVFNNSAWSEILGEEELYDLKTDPREEVNLAADDPVTAGFRERAREVLLEEHQGLRLEIRNASSGTLAGALGGSLSKLTLVKSVDPGCGCLHWQDNQATFSLTAGQRTMVFFGGLRGTRAAISGTLTDVGSGNSHAFEEKLDLRTVGEGIGFAFTGKGWQHVTAEESVDTGFWLWSAGGGSIEDNEVEGTPELLDQLRALGYLE